MLAPQNPETNLMSETDYLAFEASSPIKHEFVKSI